MFKGKGQPDELKLQPSVGGGAPAFLAVIQFSVLFQLLLLQPEQFPENQIIKELYKLENFYIQLVPAHQVSLKLQVHLYKQIQMVLMLLKLHTTF